MHEHSKVSAGVRAGLPLVLPTLALGVSFGVLARPVMGPVAPIAMSIFVFSGAAQFAALSVLAAGGGALAAITAGMLMNARWLPMGFAIGPSLQVSPHKYRWEEGWRYLSFGDDSTHRLIFTVDSHVVRSWRAGLVPAVEYVEGCS